MGRIASRHQIEWAAAGLRRAAAEIGVAVPVDYSQAVASDGLARSPELGVTRLGAGAVFHTRPQDGRALVVVVGYADRRGQWYRDGRRHSTPSNPERGTTTIEEVAL